MHAVCKKTLDKEQFCAEYMAGDVNIWFSEFILPLKRCSQSVLKYTNGRNAT